MNTYCRVVYIIDDIGRIKVKKTGFVEAKRKPDGKCREIGTSEEITAYFDTKKQAFEFISKLLFE